MLEVVALEGFFFHLGLLRGGAVGDLHDDEEDDGDDDEGDDGVEEGAPVDEGGGVVVVDLAIEGVVGGQHPFGVDELDIAIASAIKLGGEGIGFVEEVSSGELLADADIKMGTSAKAFLDIRDRGERAHETGKSARDRPGGERGQDVDERVDDRGERAADDDANGKHEGVALVNELLEFGPETFSFFFALGPSLGLRGFLFFFCHKTLL